MRADLLPKQGDRLKLQGRLFIFTEVEPPGPRGWWWKAVSVSGASTLQGNNKLRLESPRSSTRPTWVQA